VTIKPDLAVAIGETPVKRVDLARSLDAMADISKESFIFLRADRAVPYGELMDVLEVLRAGRLWQDQAGGIGRRSGGGGAGRAGTGRKTLISNGRSG